MTVTFFYSGLQIIDVFPKIAPGSRFPMNKFSINSKPRCFQIHNSINFPNAGHISFKFNAAFKYKFTSPK